MKCFLASPDVIIIFFALCACILDVAAECIPIKQIPETVVQSKPTTGEAYDCLRSYKLNWNEIGRELQLNLNDRQEIREKFSSNDSRLEAVLHKWRESHGYPTWLCLIDGLEKAELKQAVTAVKKSLLFKA